MAGRPWTSRLAGLASTELLDLEDTRLRLRARALTQLCQTEREKALAIYGFVKRIPFAKTLEAALANGAPGDRCGPG